MSDSTPDVVFADEAIVLAEESPDDAVKKSLGVAFWICIAWLVAVSAIALLAPWLPVSLDRAGGARETPSLDHFFGTDALGRDVFQLTILGARTSLAVGFMAIAAGLVFGGALGIIAGYFRGKFDVVVSFLFFSLLSFPALVLALLLVNAFGQTLTTVGFTLGVLAIAPVGRLARAATLVFAEREFVHAARVIGAKHGRIIIRELLPNVLIPMAALALLGMGVAIVAEGALAFLGLSVEGNDVTSWGTIINDGRSTRDLQDSPWVAMCPIGVMFLTILALNFAGDRIREYFDVRETAF